MSDDQQKQYNQSDDQFVNSSDNNAPKDQHTSVTISKEGEPVTVMPEAKEAAAVQYSETEPRIEDPELEKYVQVTRDEPKIHPDLKKAGLQSLDTSSLDPKHRVELPLPDEKIFQGLDQPLTSSWRWLSEVAIFMLGQAHLTLKKIHGHVVRVMKR